MTGPNVTPMEILLCTVAQILNIPLRMSVIACAIMPGRKLLRQRASNPNSEPYTAIPTHAPTP